MAANTMMAETTKYMEQRIQVARQAALNIKNDIDDLQLFVIQPSNKISAKNEALASAMRVRRLACAIMAMSDRQVNTQAAVDPELMLDMMQSVIDGKTDGIRGGDMRKITLKGIEMVGAMFEGTGLKFVTGAKSGQEAA